jgi:hypothetical protein
MAVLDLDRYHEVTNKRCRPTCAALDIHSAERRIRPEGQCRDAVIKEARRSIDLPYWSGRESNFEDQPSEVSKNLENGIGLVSAIV